MPDRDAGPPRCVGVVLSPSRGGPNLSVTEARQLSGRMCSSKGWKEGNRLSADPDMTWRKLDGPDMCDCRLRLLVAALPRLLCLRSLLPCPILPATGTERANGGGGTSPRPLACCRDLSSPPKHQEKEGKHAICVLLDTDTTILPSRPGQTTERRTASESGPERGPKKKTRVTG